MSNLELRIPAGLSDALVHEILRPGMREGVVFALGSHGDAGGREVVLIRELIVLPESAFLTSVGQGARWRGAYMFELLNMCLERNLGLFFFHAHGGDPVQMSPDDRHSAFQLLPRFQGIAPSRPHGSVIIGQSSCAGMIQMPGIDRPIERFSVRLITKGVMLLIKSRGSQVQQLSGCMPLVDGPFTRGTLRDAVVAVVGLSGGGSQVIPHLARLGIGEIIGIDNQRLERSNLLASPTPTWLQTILHWRKTTSMRWRAWWTNPHSKFIAIHARVPEKPALDAIKRADLIIGCVNNLHARADLQEIAWRYCIPYIDIGLTLRPSISEERADQLGAIAGNVFTAIPGSPCMWCAEFLTRNKLEEETDGRGRSYLEIASGDDAYVLSFNGVLASQAVCEALNLLLGYSPDATRPIYRKYDGLSGTLLEVVVRPKAECDMCEEMLCAGDPVWTTDSAA